MKMLASALQPPVTDLKAPQGQDLDMYIYIFLFVCLFMYLFIFMYVFKGLRLTAGRRRRGRKDMGEWGDRYRTHTHTLI